MEHLFQIHADQTETFLTGKDIGDIKVLQQAIEILRKEIQPELIEAEPSPAYKNAVSLALFYKVSAMRKSSNRDQRATSGALHKKLKM